MYIYTYCIYIYTDIYICIYICIFSIYIYMHIYIYILYIHIYIHRYIYMYIQYIYIHMYIYIYTVYTYIYTDIYIRIYKHTPVCVQQYLSCGPCRRAPGCGWPSPPWWGACWSRDGSCWPPAGGPPSPRCPGSPGGRRHRVRQQQQQQQQQQRQKAARFVGFTLGLKLFFGDSSSTPPPPPPHHHHHHHHHNHHSIQFNSVYLYSPISQITNVSRSALQSVHIDIPDLWPLTSHQIRKNSQITLQGERVEEPFRREQRRIPLQDGQNRVKIHSMNMTECMNSS